MLQPMRSSFFSRSLFRRRIFWIISSFLALAAMGYVFFKSQQATTPAFQMDWQTLKTTLEERLQEADYQATLALHDQTPTIVGFAQITSGEPLNSSTMATSLVCVENASDVKEIALFMPDMGHGTEPPQIKGPQALPTDLVERFTGQKDPGCFEVSKMQMYMPGLWELRVTYNSSPQVALAYWSLEQ